MAYYLMVMMCFVLELTGDDMNNFKAQGKQFTSDRGDEGGSVRWSVTTGQEYSREVYADLIVTDCYHTVSLEFSADTARQVDKRLAKLDIVIQELLSFRAALSTAQDSFKPTKFYY